MPPVVGMRGSDNLAPEQKKIIMGDAIKRLVPDETPFTTFLQSVGKESVGFPEFKALEDDVLPRLLTATNSMLLTNTLVVADASMVAPNQTLVHTSSGEIMVVTNVTGNTITVRRIATGPASVATNDEFIIAGTSFEEGSLAPRPLMANPAPISGMTQIMRRTWALTGTSYSSENEVSPHDWDFQAAKVGIEHKRDLERTLLFNGAPRKDVGVGTNTQPQRYTMGLLWAIKTNAMDAAGAFTEEEFNAFARLIFRYGAKRKVLMGSPLATSVLNTYPMSKVRISMSEKKYGVNVTTFVSPFGELGLVTNWELEGVKWGGSLVAYDPANVKYRYLKNSKANRDSHINTEIQPPDQDARTDEWLTEMGLMVNLEKTAGIVTGITGP